MRERAARPQDKETVKEYCKASFDLEVEDAYYSYKGGTGERRRSRRGC